MSPRIAIVGAGAVGGYAGAHMAQAGHDVTFIDMWPDNVEAMRASGLTITHPLHICDVQALSKEPPIGIAFICVKSYDTSWAATMIRAAELHQ